MMKDSKQNRKCVLCPTVRNTRQKMREHVLNHYKPQLFLSLPRRKPFRCPECNSKNRDKITLLRHYAFTHKNIYKFSNDKELLGILVSEEGSPVLVTPYSFDGEMTTQETAETHFKSRVSSLPINSSVLSSPAISPRPSVTGPMSSTSTIGVYMCAMCDFIADQEKELKEHTNLMHHAEHSFDKSDSDLDIQVIERRSEKFNHTSLGNVTKTWGKEIEKVKGSYESGKKSIDGINHIKKMSSEESIKHPKKVKCPHCDHVNWSKAYKYSIIHHLKYRHLDMTYLKCPFCNEVTAKFPLLQSHFRDAHEWIWDVKKRGVQKRNNRRPSTLPIKIKITSNQIGNCQSGATKIRDGKIKKRSTRRLKKRRRPPMPKNESFIKKQTNATETFREDIDRSSEEKMICVNYLEIATRHKQEIDVFSNKAIEEVDPLS